MKDVFQYLNIGVPDSWDMTIDYATTSVHTPDHVVRNQMNMFNIHLLNNTLAYLWVSMDLWSHRQVKWQQHALLEPDPKGSEVHGII
ncbi:retinol-binding protein 2 [Platysternon megacephalum]|uniref:Retinol-binding protein 2 n=1 Tax=Platysternon megacephalum TaxID=55544 RepID=A0A4D9E153_9SAUR|nr:retinol-binding protein 2 [Platysternon megacephalum]